VSVRAESIDFAYCGGRPVLCGVTLDVRPGVVTALFGPNGCGKSTLVRCLNGALNPSSGRVLFGDQPVEKMTAAEIARRVAVVPQDTPADVPFTVRQMVMLGRYAHGDTWGRESRDDSEAVVQSLERVNASHLSGRLFGTLSGGERQRVVVARALAQGSETLLMDEPAAHLDISRQLELYRLVRRLAAEGKAVLMVCHDLLLTPLFADVCVLMSAGRILAIGKAETVLCPAHLHAVYGGQISLAWPEERGVTVSFE